MPPLSPSPDGSLARDNLGNGSAAATQDIDVTALVSPSVNLQSSSPDESTLSGEKSASQGVTDGRQLPHILTLPFPFTFDVSLALSLIPTSNFSSSMAEDWAKACNNDDMRPVKEATDATDSRGYSVVVERHGSVNYWRFLTYHKGFISILQKPKC
ncbi:hypothetical protein PILCRDRAFT_814097 [Piloderma croceum F 1598]|uniref:Uncharacterized protein n=1 Tax=Piloderma croceum (strain F 1598) TaxID=765440 RepID=A0A0C3CEQ0_PILCF|nr:hypothetical protein PILCRDRAFT_814097 [Piloderma croceum F 1598]